MILAGFLFKSLKKLRIYGSSPFSLKYKMKIIKKAPQS